MREGKSWNRTSGRTVRPQYTSVSWHRPNATHTHTQSQQLNCPCLPVRYRLDPDTLTGIGNWQFRTRALVLDAGAGTLNCLLLPSYKCWVLSLRSLMKHLCVQPSWICWNCDKKPVNIQMLLFSSGCLNFKKKKKSVPINLKVDAAFIIGTMSQSTVTSTISSVCVRVCLCMCEWLRD